MDSRRLHEDFQCTDVKILKDWRGEHSQEHHIIWERLEKMEETHRTVRDIVIELRTKMMFFVGIASLVGAALGQIIARIFTK
jgi:hypothetical protein